MTPSMTDPDMIRQTLASVFSPGDVFEIRALDAIMPGTRRPHVLSGYFDYDHIDDAALSVAEIASAKGIYYTPNPVNPALLARAANRLRAAGTDPATKDNEILRRNWLLVDCDPVRPAGISASTEEHDLAHARAEEIRRGLSSMGWPEPIYCDSGNGSQLMYRVELGTGETDLVQRVLYALTATDDAAVKVDQSVFNPSRLWRLPGTLNCRGDNIPERPHRMARLISVPETLIPVTREMLESAAAPAAPTPSNPHAEVDLSGILGTRRTPTEAFDIDRWIQAHCPEVSAPTEWNGGRRWVFKVCPFNDAHTNSSAAILEQPSGAIAFTCLHDGCRQYKWADLRALREPESKGNDAIPATIVKPELIEEEQVEKVPDPGPIPQEMFHVPGLVSEVMDFTLKNAPYPNEGLAFCGALALQSYLCGRKVCDPGDLRPNIYILALAGSGTGKDFPRKVNARIMFEIGHVASLGDKFASGEGIQDALVRNNAMLFQNDEMDGMLRQINMDTENRRESIPNILMTLYTSAADIYPVRVKAGQTESVHIDQPHLTLFGTATPQFFYESLNERMLSNGFFSRMIIVDIGKRGDGQTPGIARNIPDSIMKVALWWSKYQPQQGNLAGLHPQPRVIPYTPEAAAAAEALRKLADEEYAKVDAYRDEAARAAWTRTCENAKKLAMIYACSVNHENPQIDLAAMQWASAFAMHQTRRQLYLANTYVARSPFHGCCLEVLRYIRDAPEGRVSHSEMLRKLRVKTKDLKEVIDTLTQSGEIKVETVRTKGRAGTYYKMISCERRVDSREGE